MFCKMGEREKEKEGEKEGGKIGEGRGLFLGEEIVSSFLSRMVVFVL